jgi:PAS domain S-box-containing protein
MDPSLPQFGQPVDALVRHWSELPSACCIVDQDGTFRWLNTAFATLIADDPAAVLGRPVTELPEHIAHIAEQCRESAARGEPIRIQNLRIPQPGVTPRWATGMTFPVPAGAHMMGAGLFFDLGDHADIGAELHWLLARAPVFVLCTDTDLRYTWSSGGLYGHVGMAQPGVGQTAYEILQTDDPDHPGIAPLRAALNGHEVSYRVQFNGRWFDNWVGPLNDGDGRIVGTLAAIIDVTDLEVARQQAALAEERFRRLVDQSPALIAIRDANLQISHVNPAFLRAFGQTDAQIDDRVIKEIVLRSSDADLADIEEQVRQTGLPRVWQGRLPHPDGHAVDILGHVFPLPLAGNETGIGEVFLDISEQERSRRALADSEQRYRAIFDSAEICILLLDPVGAITDVNPTYVRTTGHTLRVVRGQDFETAIAEADREENRRLWQELIGGRRTRYDVSIDLHQVDDRYVPARLTVTLIRNNGHAIGALVLAVTTGAGGGEAVPPVTRPQPTPAEAAVLQRLASGMTFQQIADDLQLTRRGVDYRVTTLRHKLRPEGSRRVPSTTAALIARAYALGILESGTWPPRIAGDVLEKS